MSAPRPGVAARKAVMAFSACFAETGSEEETLSSGASASPPPRWDSAARTAGAALIGAKRFVLCWRRRMPVVVVRGDGLLSRRVRASDAAASKAVQLSPSGLRDAALQSSVTRWSREIKYASQRLLQLTQVACTVVAKSLPDF